MSFQIGGKAESHFFRLMLVVVLPSGQDARRQRRFLRADPLPEWQGLPAFQGLAVFPVTARHPFRVRALMPHQANPSAMTCPVRTVAAASSGMQQVS